MNEYIQRIREIVLQSMKAEAVNIYLFGSWARGTARRGSDVDIAIEPLAVDLSKKIGELRDLLEESTIPYNVDVVDMSRAAEVLCDEIRREGILWKKS